jgi:phosphoglycerate kinase
VSSKLGALKNMLDRVDRMIIGGAMANTFLKSMGIDVGGSLVEDDLLETARELIDDADRRGLNFTCRWILWRLTDLPLMR